MPKKNLRLGSINLKKKTLKPRPQKKKMSPKLECLRCGANLDRGDVLEHYLRAYPANVQRATEAASAYGWSETNRVRFNKAVIVQPENGHQFVQCPECKQPLISLSSSSVL